MQSGEEPAWPHPITGGPLGGFQHMAKACVCQIGSAQRACERPGGGRVGREGHAGGLCGNAPRVPAAHWGTCHHVADVIEQVARHAVVTGGLCTHRHLWHACGTYSFLGHAWVMLRWGLAAACIRADIQGARWNNHGTREPMLQKQTLYKHAQLLTRWCASSTYPNMHAGGGHSALILLEAPHDQLTTPISY
jgi:hypothetical protein